MRWPSKESQVVSLRLPPEHKLRHVVTLLAVQLLPVLLVLTSCIAPTRDEPVVAVPSLARPAPAPLRPTPQPQPPVLTLDSSAASQGGLLRGIVPVGTTLTLDGSPVRVADNGSFVIAFDRDAPHAALLVASNAAGIVERQITVAPFAWRIENVNARMTGGAATTAEFRARRDNELAAINAARATPVFSNGWQQRFIWPVRGRISGQFGSQRVYRGEPGSYHSGTDVAAAAGTPFVAPADGVVTLAATAPFTLEGYLLIVDHGMGLSSAFLHASRLDVGVGDIVRQGQQLGLVGATGRASGPHMHWGMRWGSARIDAQRVAGPMAPD